MNEDKRTYEMNPTIRVPVNIRLTGCRIHCRACDRWRPASEFGFHHRKSDGLLMNGRQCRACKNDAAAERRERRRNDAE